jgi:tRNA 2-selenouridine synthase
MSDYIIPIEKFEYLLIRGVPFLDVRAEVEFVKGSFPTSTNIPILRDEERKVVGICYKEKGREEAIELAHLLVTGATKSQRIEAWCEFTKINPNTHIYCWRGGLRSNYAREWISEAGIEIPLIDGGFKALRQVIVGQIMDAADCVPVNAVDFSTDLEGHANHRGSSFGRRVSGVPTQIDFENALGIDLLRKRKAFPERTLVIEDEGHRIGSNTIPKAFYDKMHTTDMAMIEMPMEFRVQRIAQEYVIEMTNEFLDAHPADGWELFVDYLTQSLVRVQKRLGLENYKLIAALMEDALRLQHENGKTSGHEAWIVAMLRDYYDPMYAYQLKKQPNKITFQGSYDEVLEWAIEKSHSII